MPTSPEAMLISSILRDRDFATAVTAGMSVEMFRAYEEEWTWLADYVSRHKRIPSKTAFCNAFPKFRIKAVNDTEHYVQEVRKAYARRSLTATLREVTTAISDDDLTGAMDLLQQRVVTIGASMSTVKDAKLGDWNDAYKEVAKRVAAYDANGFAGVPTGWTSFDERTGGFQPGQLILVGGRMGEGKSWTMQRMCLANVMDGHVSHYASLEMSKIEVQMRMHNFLSGSVGREVFDAQNLYLGKDVDLVAYKQFLRYMKNSMKGDLMTISDARGIGIIEIAAHIERYKPATYYLDYLTLAKMKRDGDWADIGDFAKNLKILAGDTQCTIIAGAQLNRKATESKEVGGVETLSASDGPGMHADGVINLRKRSNSVTEFQVAKFRQVPSGFKWYSQLDTSRGIFHEITANEAQVLIERDQSMADAASIADKKLRVAR
ncbi:MAG: DnaB-like helicase C-terminal domain-containing protein [Rhizobiaceae bacterium]